MNCDELNEKLLESAISGDLEAIKECLKNGADVNYKENIEGRNALIYACRNDIAKNQFEMVETLIKHGADVNYNDKYGITPLLSILKEEKINMDIVKLLVENGADVNKEDQHQISNLPLSWCLINNKSNTNLEAIKYLVSKGADVNRKNSVGNTPLIESVKYNNIEAIKVFIANGADLNIKNNRGETALMIANKKVDWYQNDEEYGEYKAIQTLLKEHTDLKADSADSNKAQITHKRRK